ncbi:SAM and PH domain-containing protein [Pyricularia oryzae Y34]|uniref:SAM and PH domain-containing protein n=2 Tax=Pyricularia oryzae TaxID=318829 RepID=A0AA97PQ25_PYRO3|nr:SAM and PH domain-containing protein [Pyricularia oryzae Y34]
MASAVRSRSGRPHQLQPEMLQKPHLHEAFFSLKNAPQERPLSVATEFMESDFDDDEILSDVENGDNSPRLSVNSRRTPGPFKFTSRDLDTCDLANWSPEMVAQQMLDSGIEMNLAEKFVENDITGAILITLRFEDLVELGIQSFGARTKIWNEMHRMMNIRAASPRPETPIEDEPDKEVRREQRETDGADKPKRKPSRRRKPSQEDIISPLESVSIVGIEQMMPKPHHCKKGENCSKWRRNQRMIEAFKKDHPFVDMEKGGVIMVAGDPGNPLTAEALNHRDPEPYRPTSDAIPSVVGMASVVASSDIMGTDGIPPLQYLQEASLRSIQSRDPQDNVRQFLNFQNNLGAGSSEVPPTPPFELYPQQHHQPREALRALPKLSIPGQQPKTFLHPPSAVTPRVPQHQYHERSNSAGSTPEATPTAIYRFGTPFSDMDVPVTAVPLGPVARDTSQSVPPNMNFRSPIAGPQRSASRASRRPSFPVMPALAENQVTIIESPPRNKPSSPLRGGAAKTQRQIQAPPRVQYPWSTERDFEKAIAPAPGSALSSTGTATVVSRVGTSHDAEGVTHAGTMRKRKTRMLRHEWHEHYFTLKGTRLNMHRDAADVGRTLEYVDIDDYAIACSTLAGGKLNAAFRAMNIRRGSAGDDVGAFSFQLIPQDPRGGVRLLRKRESLNPAAPTPPPGEGVNGTGKPHHFAVKGRDDRIDWMRELMLAKALKQKGEGFEVSVNGNMI